MSINATTPQTTVLRNEAPLASAAAPSAEVNALVVAHRNNGGEMAEVKMSQEETTQWEQKLWALQNGMHNGMEVWQIREAEAKILECKTKLGIV
ncbi:hypothetical protein [Hydrogenophaga sp.]|uniref:hypothetical protein n=1 Tax=Hydrogenophaga sp. TaxID=1904254 RepID=UPI00271BD52C|nr:hypothetical protein [Hydrogenophaga sp.]MDO9434323.1 hypothetical protein [Hydrogenophaga sp.]